MRPDLKVPTPEVLSRFAAIVGDKGALTAREDTEPYLNEWRGLYHGRTLLVLRAAIPGSSAVRSPSSLAAKLS